MASRSRATWPTVGARDAGPGQAMVEFAFVLVLFMGLVLAIFDGARLVLAYFAVGNAAQDGARAAAFVPTSQRPLATLDADARAAVRRTTAFLGSIPDGDIVICRRTTRTLACGTAVQRGALVEVTVSYRFYFVPSTGGWLGQVSLPLSGYHRAQID